MGSANIGANVIELEDVPPRHIFLGRVDGSKRQSMCSAFVAPEMAKTTSREGM